MTKKYKTNHAKEAKKQQHCPTCNRYIKYIAGRPAYICLKCIQLATDKDGKEIIFKTITESGNGIQGVYKVTGKLYRSRICYVKGIRCQVEEANVGIFNTTPKGQKENQVIL